MKVAVVTDAVSPDNYFPAWFDYYAGLFGKESIHVFTYLGNQGGFGGFTLGGLHTLSDEYNDDLRKDAITAFVAQMLVTHDVVLRVDVDEFLVPDPAKFNNLSDYLGIWSGSHLTAYGFDLFQSPEEPTLDLQKPIMAQRRFAYALTALNKTCVTRVPLRWNRGFHFCSLPPVFGDVFLFHTKRADIGLQNAWNKHMRDNSDGGDFVKSYYGWDEAKVRGFHTNRLRLPLIEGQDALDRAEFNREFVKSIHYVKGQGIFDGPYNVEQVNVAIPDRFKQFF